MWAFAAPALGALLLDPVLSLVDTACVGRLGSGAVGIAALGPNTAVFAGVAQLFSFLTTGTTAASARAASPEEAGEYAAAAVPLAFALGVAVAYALQAFGDAVLAALSVGDAARPLAVDYLRARAWGAPLLLTSFIATAVLLGQKDAGSVLRAAVAGGACNLALDVLLVPRYDVVGAAVATVVAQAVSLVVLIRAVRGHVVVQRLPKLAALAPLRGCVPVAVRSALLMLSLSLLTGAAAALGTVATAAHQVALSAMVLAQFLPEPVSQCAQAYLARGTALAADAHAAGASSRTLLRCSAKVAAFAGVLVLVPCALPGIFTTDAGVAIALGTVAAPLCAAAVMLPLVCVTDGLLLARGDYAFCTANMVATLAVVVAYLHLGRPSELAVVWGGYVVFQGSRLAQNSLRLASSWGTHH